MHFLYIIYSIKLNTFYVGESLNVNNRLQQHNQHYFKRNFTKSTDDWILKLSYKCKSKKEALFLEKFIKRMKSKIFIEKIIGNPEILKNILVKNDT